jgi:hypothetical protein
LVLSVVAVSIPPKEGGSSGLPFVYGGREKEGEGMAKGKKAAGGFDAESELRHDEDFQHFLYDKAKKGLEESVDFLDQVIGKEESVCYYQDVVTKSGDVITIKVVPTIKERIDACRAKAVILYGKVLPDKRESTKRSEGESSDETLRESILKAAEKMKKDIAERKKGQKTTVTESDRKIVMIGDKNC